MSEEKFPVVDSSREDRFSHLFPRLPVPHNHKVAWSGISLEHHHQPPGEIPDYSLDCYRISINIGQSFLFERVVNGQVQKGLALSGAVGLNPVDLTLALRWDKEIHILLIDLEPELLTCNAQDLLKTDRVEIVPHFAIRDPLIQQIGLALKAELKFNGSESSLYAESMANALAVHLLRHYSREGSQPKAYSGGLPRHKLRLVTDYINDNLMRELGLHELAAIAQLSPYHFSRTFKQSAGISPYQYVIQQRIERAKQLLRQGKMSIAEIALACGFSHQSHLTRHFKRLTGVTPKILLNS